jgi:hypothetical protein
LQKQTPRKQARSCTARNTSSDNASDSTCKARLQHTGTGAESDADTEDGSEFELLGMLVADVDGAAGNFVYGLLGMPGRRKGVMDTALQAWVVDNCSILMITRSGCSSFMSGRLLVGVCRLSFK